MNGSANSGPPIVEVNKKFDGTDVDYYNDAAKYWEGVDGTVNGMLGGFGKVSEVDIEGSNKLLKMLFKVIPHVRQDDVILFLLDPSLSFSDGKWAK